MDKEAVSWSVATVEVLNKTSMGKNDLWNYIRTAAKSESGIRDISPATGDDEDSNERIFMSVAFQPYRLVHGDE